jgi:hypothetical protein
MSMALGLKLSNGHRAVFVPLAWKLVRPQDPEALACPHCGQDIHYDALGACCAKDFRYERSLDQLTSKAAGSGLL